MVSDPILYPEDFEKDKDTEIIKLTGRIQSLHADLDIFAMEITEMRRRIHNAGKWYLANKFNGCLNCGQRESNTDWDELYAILYE